MAVDGLETVVFEQFGGLQLSRDPGDGSDFALDAKNVIFNSPTAGSVGTRWGFTTMANLTGSVSAAGRHIRPTSNGYCVSHQGATVGLVWHALYDFSGSALAQQVAPAAGGSYSGGVRWIAPGVDRLYLSALEGNYRLEGTTFTAVNAAYKAIHVAAWEARLVYGYLAAGNGYCRVQFSDPDTPETFPANNYVELEGEITGMTAWGSSLFVFTTEGFFVFYGTSTDSSGNPIFNYRKVSYGITARLSTWGTRSVVAGGDGVYFSAGTKIYRTDGGVPVHVSAAIDPYLESRTLPFFMPGTSVVTTLGAQALDWIDNRLYVHTYGYSGSFTFVWDIKYGQWAMWDTGLVAVAAPHKSQPDTDKLWGVRSASTCTLVRFRTSYTTDDGAAINSTYRAGFSSFGTPGKEKNIRQTVLTGMGSINFGWAREFDVTAAPAVSAVTLGTSPTRDTAMHRVSQRGDLLSPVVSSSSTFTLERFVAMVRSVRGAGEKT